MTEQIEDEFWAQARAEDAAARGRHADPSACGTCRSAVEAGEQVEHDGCAKRATLIQAPDHPSYELITGLSEEELAALPPRFHVPAYMESSSPQLWVCAVCWGDGWVTGWPCKTAVKHGLRVFTPEHEAETAAKRQAAALAKAQADAAEAQVRITELEAELAAAKERHREGLRRADEHVNAMNEELKRYADGTETPVLWSVYKAMHLRADNAEARVTELERELKKYVGAEPTIAEEMAYLGRCLDAVYAVCDQTEKQATRWEHPLPVPEWVVEVRKAADGEWTATTPRPALPWAHVMDDDDLHLFLDDLVSAALNRWQTDQDGPIPDRVTLAEIEKACAQWRTPGQGHRSDEDAPEAASPDARDCTTCEHHLPATPAEEQCNPDGCGCTGYPEACDVSANPAGAAFPISDCPRWQART